MQEKDVERNGREREKDKRLKQRDVTNEKERLSKQRKDGEEIIKTGG